MKADIKNRWLEALRSGEFAQGRGALAKESYSEGASFCCLGVLCELARADGVVQRRLDDDEGELLYGTGGEFEDAEAGAGLPPVSVRGWAGLAAADPRVLDDSLVHHPAGDGTGACLSRLNDEGLTFPQIADVIERYL